MKVNKLITVDVEVAESLGKEKNASKLINDFLVDYYSSGGKLAKQELINKRNIKMGEHNKLEGEIKELDIKIEAVEKREKELKSIYKEIPDEVLEDFKAFPNMSIKVLMTRYREIYSKKYKVKWEIIEKAHGDYYGGDKDG